MVHIKAQKYSSPTIDKLMDEITPEEMEATKQEMLNAIAREQWFIDRIGKIVFRNKTTCKCETCKNVYEQGLIIHDKTHATYLYDMEGCYNYEGYPLKYFDTKEEMLEFEKTITK